jgi:protein-S-isoprenylcysteine O-methyltransferase Ste14
MPQMRSRNAAIGTVVFFVLAPGVVAGAIPRLLTGWHVGIPWPIAVRAFGAVLTAAGVVVLMQAFARFVREGRGTPAPVAPTETLVVGGLYRFVRNPMYLAVLATIIGQALLFGRPILFGYAFVVWLAFASFVRVYEEPNLTDRFGEGYRAYREHVPAWIPRRSPWSPSDTVG